MLTAVAMMLSFTSCSSDDDPTPVDKSVTVSFENQTLNSEGFWCGTKNEKGTSVESWGTVITTYPNTYVEGALTFNTDYSWTEAYDYWYGYAISNRTATSYAQLTPDQYNNNVGKANSGSKFCVVYGDKTIDVSGAKGAVINYMYVTNSAYTTNTIVNGDSYAKKFEASDWLTCTVKGTHVDGTTATVDIKLAQGTSYIKAWEKVNLSALGAVTKLTFSFDGSDKGAYGLNTPTYVCIDDINYTLVE